MERSTGLARMAIGTGACAACCAVPMAVVLGVVSITSLLTFGIPASAITAIGLLAWAVATRRVDAPSRWIGRSLGAAGLAVVATWGVDDVTSTEATIALTLITLAALLSLAAANEPARRTTTP